MSSFVVVLSSLWRTRRFWTAYRIWPIYQGRRFSGIVMTLRLIVAVALRTLSLLCVEVSNLLLFFHAVFIC